MYPGCHFVVASIQPHCFMLMQSHMLTRQTIPKWLKWDDNSPSTYLFASVVNGGKPLVQSKIWQTPTSCKFTLLFFFIKRQDILEVWYGLVCRKWQKHIRAWSTFLTNAFIFNPIINVGFRIDRFNQ